MDSMEAAGWKPVPVNLSTKWAAEVTPEHVLPEYPRPQMVRERWMNLNGLWDYAIRPLDDKSLRPAEASAGAGCYDGKILVPFPLEASLSGVRKKLLPDKMLWYRRTFAIPSDWKGSRLLLHFGAVDWKAEVWVNNRKAGEHTGGYYPFHFEISKYLTDGENELVVGVWDPTDTFGQERGKQVLRPSGIFYTPVSGIWQTVWLEPVPEDCVETVRITPDIDSGEVRICIGSSVAKQLEFEAAAYDGDREIACSAAGTPSGGVLSLKLPEVKLWSPDTPFLYNLKIRLLDAGRTVDEIQSYFGMRKFSVEPDQQGIPRLFLNNRPLFQNGILDQGFWPDGLYTAPTDEALEYDVQTAKNFGFNMIRKHLKVEPARWYYHCDRLGLIVWQDMINGGAGLNMLNNFLVQNALGRFRISDHNYKRAGREKESNRANYKKELKELIDALYNAPCIGMWVPFNEAWGQFDAAETAAWVKEYDPTRCVDHVSGWSDQGAGDVKSLHQYFVRLSLPKRKERRALAITEFGGYSLKLAGHVWRENMEFGYRRFTSADFLKTAYTYLIRGQVKPLIKQGLAAVIYTQLTDVETEVNGLMTYDRAVEKIDPALLQELSKELV